MGFAPSHQGRHRPPLAIICRCEGAAGRIEKQLVLCAAKCAICAAQSEVIATHCRVIEGEAEKTDNDTTNMAAPYIPSKDADFDPWFDNFQGLIGANPTDYGLIAGDATVITASYDAWHPAYLLASNPTTRTAPNVAAKGAQRASAEATIRPYAQQIARNAGIDPALVTGLGLNLPNATRPPIPAPTDTAVLSLISGTFLRHALAFKTVGFGPTKKKPVGSAGLEVWRAIGVVAATDPAQCGLYQTWTKSPNASEFVAGDRGKLCTYFCRYVTRSGPAGTVQTGPWSDALTLVVM